MRSLEVFLKLVFIKNQLEELKAENNTLANENEELKEKLENLGAEMEALKQMVLKMAEEK